MLVDIILENTSITKEFLQTLLSSSINIIKYSSQVTRKFSNRKFSLLYNNRQENFRLTFDIKIIKQ